MRKFSRTDSSVTAAPRSFFVSSTSPMQTENRKYSHTQWLTI